MHARAGTPMQIKGKMLQPAVLDAAKSQEDRDEKTARAFLRAYRHLLRLKDPDRELKLSRLDRDDLGRRHLRFSQMYRGLPVWPAELIVQLDTKGHVDLMSGAYVPTPRKLTTRPVLDVEAATARALKAVPGGNDAEVSDPTLIIYAPMDRPRRLAWKLEVNVSIVSCWLVVIDALNGSTLNAYNQVREANVAGSGVDLFGITRQLHVWEEGGTFYMVDTSKPMFDPSSNPPNSSTTRGGIVILDARNQGSEDKFSMFPVTSASPTSWDAPDAVSAAFGLSQTYDYYLERHGRNSLNGQGERVGDQQPIGNRLRIRLHRKLPRWKHGDADCHPIGRLLLRGLERRLYGGGHLLHGNGGRGQIGDRHL
ncbi:MAG: hypothetical protein HYS70_03170 [Nitrospinae bacterium]|nr:hypothetical protein [Nitrospinota bacterium]